MPNLVLVAQAAQDSPYTDAHIRLLLRKGAIQGQKVGGTWLVDMDDLRRYEQEMQRLGAKRHDPTRGDEKA